MSEDAMGSMQVSTGENGESNAQPENTLQFPEGIPGFETQKSFRLIHDAEQEKPSVHYLQAVDDPDVQLPVVDPRSLQVDYEITLSDEECELLQLEDPADCAVLLVLFRGGDDRQSGIRANFLGPLLINTTSRIGMQKILNAVERNVTIRAQ